MSEPDELPEPDSFHNSEEFMANDEPPEQAELNLLQVADIHPFVPRQFQVEVDPHDPALFESLIPVVHENSVSRLQEPSIGHGGLSFLQFVTSVPPPVPRQLHLDTHPHTQAS